MPSFSLSILVLSLLLRGSVATVTLLSESDSRSVATYPSRPAAFGNEFEWGLEYGARVQLPPDGDWWLCGGGDDAKEPPVGAGTGEAASWAENADSDEEEASAEESAWEFRRLRRLRRRRPAKDDTATSTAKHTHEVPDSASGKGTVIVPPDGMPGKYEHYDLLC